VNKSQQFIEQEKHRVANNYQPLEIVLATGRGIYVTDADGKIYMDFLAGYGAVNQGHNHPRIIQAAIHHLQTGLTHTSRAVHNDQLGSFAELLCSMAKKEKFLPMNSGGEAVETALKLARKWGYLKKGIAANKAEIIVAAGNFHGRTIAEVSASTEAQYKEHFGPLLPGIKIIPYANSNMLRKAITGNTAGFLLEPIQVEGGVNIPPEGFLREAYAVCKKNNVLFMADEVQTGFGRTGKLFASWHEDVSPDILIVGKSLSGGIMPISGVLADADIMDVIKPGDHGSTFAGSPFASAVGKAALEVLADEKMSENAAEMGEYLLKSLQNINSKKIKEVRGKGLLLGIALQRSAGTPRKYCEKLIEEGILCFVAHDVIRLTPPLVITREDIDKAITIFEKVFSS
jgi:ornithine--oxo-acid transaminase